MNKHEQEAAAKVVAALSRGRRGSWWREQVRHDARVALLKARGLVPLPYTPATWVPLLRTGNIPVDTTMAIDGFPSAQASTNSGPLTYWTEAWAVFAIRHAIREPGAPHTEPYADTMRAAELLAMGPEVVQAMVTVKALQELADEVD